MALLIPAIDKPLVWSFALGRTVHRRLPRGEKKSPTAHLTGSHAPSGRQSGQDLSHSSGIPGIASPSSRRHTPRNLHICTHVKLDPNHAHPNHSAFPLREFSNAPSLRLAGLRQRRELKADSGGPVYFVERMRPIPHTLGSYKNFHFIMGLVSGEVLYSEQSGGQYSQEPHQTQFGLANVVHAGLICCHHLHPRQPNSFAHFPAPRGAGVNVQSRRFVIA